MDKITFLLLATMLNRVGAINYAVTASEKFRPDTDYKFIVTIYGESSVSYQLKARIKNIQSEDSIAEAEFQVEPPGSPNVFHLRIPRLVQAGQYAFQVVARGDVVFNKSHRVQLDQKSHSLFIQTDKYFYKPGQTVLFRVLGIKPDLKPFTDPIDVTIHDESGNKILELLHQTNESGVISGHLKLSNITPLGKWTIGAATQSLKKDIHFEVAEYVLPKFDVKVLLPKYFFINDENPSLQESLPITITATYTFGKPVKGFALLTIRLQKPYFGNFPRIFTRNLELIGGKADVTLTLDELKLLQPRLRAPWKGETLFVQANITEAMTGVILHGDGMAHVLSAKFRYKLKFLGASAKAFKPGFPYRAYIKLSQADDSQPKLSDIRFPNGTFKPIKISLLDVGYSREYYLPLTSHGIVICDVSVEQEHTFARIKATFYDEVSKSLVVKSKHLEKLDTRDNKYIHLSIANSMNVIKPSSNLTFNVGTSEVISSFQCQVIGKGTIHHSDLHFLENPSNNNTFSIFISEHMALNLAPQATIVVFYVTSTGELVADSLSLPVSEYMTNKVSLTINPESTSPGEELLVRVNASQDSFVSLSAIDQSVLLLSAGNYLTQEMILEDLRKYAKDVNRKNDPDYFRYRFPCWVKGKNANSLLKNSGIFILTNYHIQRITEPWVSAMEVYNKDFSNNAMEVDYDEDFSNNYEVETLSISESEMYNQSQSIKPKPTRPPRKNFPETWIWSDVQVNPDGLLELKYKVPDTITSWVASAFVTSSRFGLGITEYSTKVTVIKPFFILLNLPYSVIRGEEFALQVTVFNYFGVDLPVTVTLLKSSYYQVKECIHGTERLFEDDFPKNGFVKDSDAVSIYFWIVPTSLGQIPIEVRAVTAVAGDSLIRSLLVKPEGEQQSQSFSSLIRIPSEDLSVINFDVSLPPPEILVPDSVIIEATLIGDVLGTTINNLDNLLKMPYGCGEQNMVTLAPDVYIVKYLTATNQLTEEIKNKALEFINAGYQRELTYQRIDGSFSAFGNSDQAGSVWLSAFVAKVFHEAQDVIPVDDGKMANTIRWILRHQNDAGAFSEPPNGKVLHTAMQGGASSGIGLTAYVLISLLVNRNIRVDDMNEKISKTVSYLEEQYETHVQDPYVLSIIGYALYLAGSPKLNDVLASLNSLAVQEGGMKHWHKSVPGEDSHSFYLKPQSNDIEMTSYVLQIYASQLSLNDGIPIAKWLISKRNPEGGFTSTQDTVLGLEALAMFGHMVSPQANAEGLIVQVTQNVNENVHIFTKVNKETALLLQSHQLPSDATRISFLATGVGMALAQLNVRFNIKSGTENTFLHQELQTTLNDTRINLRICASWNGPEETGMVLTEVNLLTGYTLAEDYSDVLKEQIGSIFKKAEFSNNRLSIYLDELTETCFTANMESIFYVNNVKPALVKTYRYYAPGVSVSGYYSPTSTSARVDVCHSTFNQPTDENNDFEASP